MEVIELDLYGRMAISTQGMAFNLALAYRSRPAKRCYTSQTCSCGLWYHIWNFVKILSALIIVLMIYQVSSAHAKTVELPQQKYFTRFGLKGHKSFVNFRPWCWIDEKAFTSFSPSAPTDLLLLTLYVRGPSYPGLTRSVSWLLMPWLLVSPGPQQPWYWLCKLGRPLSYMRKDFN